MNQIIADLGQEQSYQIIVEQIKNAITGWNVEENKIIENLQSRLSNTELANINLIQKLTCYLKPLDQFTISNVKYAQIELYCEQALNQQVNQTYQQLSLFFTNQQFDLAQKALNKLNKDKQQIQEATEYARQYLQQYFHNYCVNVQNITQMSLQNFQIQYFNQIIQQLQQMNQITSIQSVEGNYILNWQQNQAQISIFIQQIKQIIQPELIMQKCSQIPEGDYLQKEQLIQIMQQIITTLKQITEKIIQNQFMDVLSQIQDINNKFEYQIQQSIDNQSRQINNCKLNVKNNYQICVQFFNSLIQAAKIQQQKYSNIYQNVITDLQSEFEKQFNVFESKDSEEIADIIQNIEQNLKYLPKQIVDNCQTNLQKLINIQETKKTQAENITYETATKDLKEIIMLYANYGNQQQYEITKIYQKIIQTEIQKQLKQINYYLSLNDLNQIFDILPSAWDDWIIYLEELNKFKLNKICQNSKFSTYYIDLNINSQIDQLITTVIEVYNKSCQIILKEIVNIDNLKHFEKITKNIDNLLCYLTNLQNNSSLSQHLKKIKQDQELENDIFSKLLKIFQDKQVKFQNREQYLENGNTDQLLKVILFAEQTDNLYQSLLNFSKSETCKICQQFMDFNKIISHKQMMQLLLSQIETNENECMNVIFICQDTGTANQNDRDQFYKQIYKAFKFIQVFRQSQIQFADIDDLSKIETKIMNKFNQQVENIYQEVEKQIKQLPNERSIQKQFSNLCDNLRSIGENFDQQQVANTAKSKILSVNMLFEQKSNELLNNVEQIKNQNQLQSICQLLIEFKKMSVDIPQFKKQIDSGIDKCINHIQIKSGQQTILKIGNLLQTHIDATSAHLLISEHEKFKQISRTIRNTLRFTMDDILDQKQENKDLYGDKFTINKGLYVIQQENSGNLKIQQINCGKIKEYYQLMDEKYWKLVEEHQFQVNKGLNIIYQNIQNQQNKRIDQYTLQVKIDIVSQVFAFWTLQNVQKSDTNINLMDSKNELLQPHAAQVVAIFSLLGIDQSNQLKNQLIQVLTGEGKSVILAVTAIVLAIMGFDVNCACYSEYLSQRDYESFTDLFNAFNVRENISYGTFNQMCERYINEDGEIRKLTEDCILKNKLDAKKNNKMPRQKVLMIDEVDVFFNESFYGSSYTPMARVQNSEIKALLDYVWQNRNEKNLMNNNSIMKTQEYLNCEKSLKGWEELLKEALNNMILDIQQFDQHEYAVQDGLIGYKDQDTISTRIFYGYKTLFAYYQEVENPKKKGENDAKVQQKALDERKCLYFSCGSFSYAEIPKNYQHIIGVTGTLDTVSKPEMKLLTDEYNIKKFSYLPSVYGTNQLKFAKDSSDFVKIVEQKEYFLNIVSEINKRRQNKIGIPVLVFFETSAKLNLFYKSSQFKNIENYQQVKLFTEKVDSKEKEGVVRQAVTQNTVTLITREFGRGTDFICYDKTIDDYGGVHVIQTFFSDELSEEKQIKGRTARQGKRGSYSLVLLDIDLQKYGLRTKHIETMKDQAKLHSTIDPLRQKYFDNKYPERIRNQKQVLDNHKRTGIYVKAVFDGNLKVVRKHLIFENRGYSVDQSKSKTLILLDATGSMGEVIEKTKNTIKTMFTNAYTIMKENNVAESFEVMIAAYRNYSDNDQLFQCSGWEKNPDNLRMFIDTIKAFGGSSWGEEAIEVGLQHSNAELANGLTQVILIGDMGPNTREQIQIGRGFNGPDYWNKTPFTQTYFEDELEQLKGKVKVHALYVDQEAKGSFEYIAKYTAGECRELDIRSEKGAENLTHLVTERIVENIGGEALLKKYNDKFGYV
ncbi:Helicase-related_protein [Hexamita inflata]|uniref:Helicase-related protein n=1 Tax=Hexamita inflata TaxID=28002 RepID=A0AA86TJI8_9EUKA|nr:Helicase-related protein [Hexamita inflata]